MEVELWMKTQCWIIWDDSFLLAVVWMTAVKSSFAVVWMTSVKSSSVYWMTAVESSSEPEVLLHPALGHFRLQVAAHLHSIQVLASGRNNGAAAEPQVVGHAPV